MASLLWRCLVNRSSIIHPKTNFVTQSSSLITRSIFTSPVLQYKTKKRRKRYPFFWLQDKYHAHYDEKLTSANEQFFKKFLEEKYSLNDGASPLKDEPWSVDTTYRENSSRTGVIAKKLGTFPIWDKQGRRYLTTCLMVSDNHVIKYHSPEEYALIGRPIDRTRHKDKGCIVVGSDSQDPRLFTAEYNGLFEESGVMPKRKLTRFFISHDARIEPGTPLLASHFRPGMYVDVYGKTIEFGPKGVRFRYKLKLGCKTHGNTKNHNRIGSIGRGRKVCGPLKGRRMPGHEGGERCHMVGLRIWRVNTKYNLLFVHGPGLPGLAGDYLNVMDSRLSRKRPTVQNPPPFPTTSLEENVTLDEELYEPSIHRPSEPSITFEISEEERKAAALASRRIGKAKTAQKNR